MTARKSTCHARKIQAHDRTCLFKATTEGWQPKFPPVAEPAINILINQCQPSTQKFSLSRDKDFPDFPPQFPAFSYPLKIALNCFTAVRRAPTLPGDGHRQRKLTHLVKWCWAAQSSLQSSSTTRWSSYMWVFFDTLILPPHSSRGADYRKTSRMLGKRDPLGSLKLHALF